MSKERLLALFVFAGLILGLVAGIYFYRSNRGPSREETAAFLAEYIGKIAEGDLSGARDMMTDDTRFLLRDPGTVLGETMYRMLSLRSTENILPEGDGIYTADVVLNGPDRLKITAKAGILFGERAAEEGPAEDADRRMAEIYEEILAREDLPMLDSFCLVRLEFQNGKLLIRGDEALQQALEGGISLSPQ